MQAIVPIGYFILGLFQLAAVMDGLEHWWGLNWFIAMILAIPISYFPLVGTITGMFGAVTVWHWSWLQATGLFFAPFLAIVVIAISSNFLEKRR
jgi:hypothetical protein